MKFEELNAPSLKDLFVRQVEDHILSGKLSIGEKLPNERELASQLKVSRSIINSGMQELADKAFIRIVPRQGAYVEDYINNGNIRTLSTIVKGRGIRFDRRLTRSFIDYRSDTEVVCAGLAARNRNEEDLEELTRKLSAIRNATRNEEYVHAALAFHKQIFITTHNIIYPMIYNAFYDVAYEISLPLLAKLDRDETLAVLRHIFDSIKARDSKAAEEITRSYVNACTAILSDLFDL